MKAFKVALQLLTRLPVEIPGSIERQDYGQSLLFYPLVGLLMAICLFLLACLAQWLPVNLVAVMVLFCWVLLSGALHLSALANCTHAWLAAYGDKEKTLRLLKEQASSPSGTCSIVLVLIAKFAALQVVLQQGLLDMALALLFTLVLGRLAVVYLFANSEYVRKMGLGFTIAENLQKPLARNLVLGLLLGIVLAGLTTGAMAVIAACLSFVVIDRLSRARLGGFTGDVAGALIEITETAVLFCCCISFYLPGL